MINLCGYPLDAVVKKIIHKHASKITLRLCISAPLR